MKNKLITLYFSHKLIVYPLACGLVGLLLIILVIIPQIRSYFENRAVLRQTTHRKEVLELKADQLEKLDGSGLSQNLSQALAALPTEKDFTGVIGSVQRLTSQFGYSLIALTVSQAQIDTSGGSGFVLSLEVGGPKQNFEALLKSFETTVPVMKVKSIEIGSLQTDSVGATLQLDVYYSAAPSTFGAVDEPLASLTEEDKKIVSSLSQLAAPAEATTSVTLTPRGKPNPFE